MYSTLDNTNHRLLRAVHAKSGEVVLEQQIAMRHVKCKSKRLEIEALKY